MYFSEVFFFLFGFQVSALVWPAITSADCFLDLHGRYICGVTFATRS